MRIPHRQRKHPQRRIHRRSAGVFVAAYRIGPAADCYPPATAPCVTPLFPALCSSPRSFGSACLRLLQQQRPVPLREHRNRLVLLAEVLIQRQRLQHVFPGQTPHPPAAAPHRSSPYAAAPAPPDLRSRRRLLRPHTHTQRKKKHHTPAHIENALPAPQRSDFRAYSSTTLVNRTPAICQQIAGGPSFASKRKGWGIARVLELARPLSYGTPRPN